MGGQGWGSLVPPTIQCTLGKGWAFLLMEEGGAFASCKGRRISLAWCVLLQKGGFSSKGKGNETEKCFLLSRRDGEPCVISAVCGGCSLRIRGQRPQGAGGLRDTGPAPALRLRVGTATWMAGSAWGQGSWVFSTQIPVVPWTGPMGAQGGLSPRRGLRWV